MLRAAGMFFIMIGAAGLGGYLRSCLRGRLEQLVECRELFAEMDALREYVRLPYEQLLRRTAKGRNSIFAEICNEVADEMEKNENADVKGLWQDSFFKTKTTFVYKGRRNRNPLSIGKKPDVRRQSCKSGRNVFFAARR